MGYSNREKCDVMVAKFLDHNNNWTIYDGDRNENGKKAVFLSQHVNKTTTLHVYHAFFRLLPYQYNPSLGCFRKCHSLAPHERQTNSVILLNNGLHFITSTKFSIYRKVIDGIVDLFKETKKNERCEVELKFKGKIIRTTNRGSQRKKTYKKTTTKHE